MTQLRSNFISHAPMHVPWVNVNPLQVNGCWAVSAVSSAALEPQQQKVSQDEMVLGEKKLLRLHSLLDVAPGQTADLLWVRVPLIRCAA